MQKRHIRTKMCEPKQGKYVPKSKIASKNKTAPKTNTAPKTDKAPKSNTIPHRPSDEHTKFATDKRPFSDHF